MARRHSKTNGIGLLIVAIVTLAAGLFLAAFRLLIAIGKAMRWLYLRWCDREGRSTASLSSVGQQTLAERIAAEKLPRAATTIRVSAHVVHTPARSAKGPVVVRSSTPIAHEETIPAASALGAQRVSSTPGRGDLPVASVSQAPTWVPLDSTARSGTVAFSRGGFYVGDPRRSTDSSWGAEPALVNPTLPISAPADMTADLGYWPSYARLLPSQRGVFLKFLQSSRDATDLPIGYLFIYYYGIERRLLIDAPVDDGAQAETGALIAELDRLIGIYAPLSSSFAHYARELRNLAFGLYVGSGDPPSLEAITPGQLLPSLEVGFARQLAAKAPLPAKWAMAWAFAAANAPRSYEWQSVREEVALLFALRYGHRFGRGLVLDATDHLSVAVRGAAANRPILKFRSNLPNPASVANALPPLVQLLVHVVQDLEPLRKVRRSKYCHVLAEALAIPPELQSTMPSPTLQALRTHAHGAINGADAAIVRASELREWAGLASDKTLSKRDTALLAQALETVGVGIEPDIRVGSALDEQAAVFALGSTPYERPNAALATAFVLLNLAYAVASADGEVDRAESALALDRIEKLFDLSADGKRRLTARLRLLEATTLSVSKLLAKLRTLDDSHRRGFAEVLIAIANADGRIDPAEVRLLDRIYKALGLDPASLPGDLHRAATSKDGGDLPVAMALDARAIAAKLADTAKVQTMLTSIFAEEKPETAPPAPDSASSDPLIAGLDGQRSALATQLLHWPNDTLDRTTFEKWCDLSGLLADGSMEMINEASFDIAGCALLDGDEELAINADARKALLASVEKVVA